MDRYYKGNTIPDALELKGVRGWRLNLDWTMQSEAINPRLGSVYMSRNIWTPGWNKAECLESHLFNKHEENPPHPQCECGIYALHLSTNREDLNRLKIATIREYHPDVIGVIEARGFVLMGSLGWRAEYARVVELWWDAPAIGWPFISNDYDHVRTYSGWGCSRAEWNDLLKQLSERYNAPLVEADFSIKETIN